MLCRRVRRAVPVNFHFELTNWTQVFVVQEAWTTNEVFTDLFALGSGLPGPAFIQLAFSIVLLRAGYLPAFLSVFLLAYVPRSPPPAHKIITLYFLRAPGAFIMLGIGFAVQRIPATLPPVVLALFSVCPVLPNPLPTSLTLLSSQGLNSAAVALVAVAAFSLSKTVITDKLTRLVLLASACIACCCESLQRSKASTNLTHFEQMSHNGSTRS